MLSKKYFQIKISKKTKWLLLLFVVVFSSVARVFSLSYGGGFVEWPFLYVVAGSCFFFNGSDNAVVSKKCCSMTSLYLLLLSLACWFLPKKIEKSNLQETALLLCLFDGVVFCSTARFYLLSVEGTPCWTACTLCYHCLQGAFVFHENWKNNTKILYFVVPCSCFCWTARFCSCLLKCLLLTAFYIILLLYAFFQKN